MKSRDFDTGRLDVEAFAKAEGHLQGTWPLSELERLTSSVVPGQVTGDVAWQARGELRPVRGSAPQIWLHISADASLALECQRCLGPVVCPVHGERSFLFVHGENTAAELDADSEDDVLALTRALDLRELIEDELLLEIPLVPRHEECPAPLVVPADPAEDLVEEKPNPFAVLASLKRGDLPN